MKAHGVAQDAGFFSVPSGKVPKWVWDLALSPLLCRSSVLNPLRRVELNVG